MSDDAQSLIAHAQGLITIYADDVQQAMLDGVYGPLSDAFDRSAPFDAVARAWWAIPGGSFGTGRGMALAWIWRRLLKGGNPAELLKSLEKMLSEKSYTARVIRPFSGVTTEYCQFLTKKHQFLQIQFYKKSGHILIFL